MEVLWEKGRKGGERVDRGISREAAVVGTEMAAGLAKGCGGGGASSGQILQTNGR